MTQRVVVAGSLDAVVHVARQSGAFSFDAHSDVVLLPTAAAFTGVTAATVRAAAMLEEFDVRVEALMITDRSSVEEEYFAQRVREARWVLLLDGSALHARTTWRESPVGRSLRDAAGIVALGETATVIGAHMIDPRGGAPTTGLGLCEDVVFTTPSSASQMARTRDLLTDGSLLVIVDEMGVVVSDGTPWRQASEGGVTCSRDRENVELARVTTR